MFKCNVDVMDNGVNMKGTFKCKVKISRVVMLVLTKHVSKPVLSTFKYSMVCTSVKYLCKK